MIKTYRDYLFDGQSALHAVLAKSEYGSLEQAVASLAVFAHPETVKQTENKALFRIRRWKSGEQRGQIVEAESIVTCDNLSPIQAFLWSHSINRRSFKESQFNHIYRGSQDPSIYTSLANICITPAFLAKLTDKNARIIGILKYHAFSQFGFYPTGRPKKPSGYDELQWAEPLEAVPNLKANLEKYISRNPKSRIAISIKQFGWFFSD